MNGDLPYQNLAIGGLALLFGLATLVMRIVAPEQLGKLGAMRKRFGPFWGTLVHFVMYTIVPLAVAATMLYGEYQRH